MASTNGGNIKFGVLFQANKTGLNLITKSLQQIQTLASKIKAGDSMYEGFQKASKAAKELESILGKSWNDKLGQLNLDKFNQSVKNSYGSVLKLKAELTGAGASGQAAFNSMASQVLNTNVQLRLSNRLLDSMATSMANTVKWGITSAIFNSITGSIQHAYNYAEQLNSSLNNIRIVTGDSADQMDRFARTANDAAKELGRSTLDYTKAAQTFYQQGLSQDEVEARTAVTLKAENITGAGSLMADYLTSVFNGFKVEAADTLGVVDKLAKVADSSASNMRLLAIAMSKVAATANVVGVDVDQLNAMLATVIATTRQAPEAVGTAYKSIFARLNDIATGAEDAEISLGNYSSKMAELGFSVLDANGNLRETGLVIELIGGRWDTLTKAQQIYLAQTMGGQRQITQVVALFDNWTKYSELLNESLTAQGTLDEKNNTYLESTAAHLKQLQAEQERTYDALFDMNTVNFFVDAFRGITEQFNNFIEGIGGGVNAFVNFGSVLANIFNVQIGNAINKQLQNIETLKNNLAQVKTQLLFSNAVLTQTRDAHLTAGQDVSQAALEKLAAIAQKTLEIRKALTQEQYNLLQGLQQQVGVEQTRIDYLSQYKSILTEIGVSENASTQIIKDRLDYNQQELDLQKLIADYILLSLIPQNQLTLTQRQRIVEALDILLAEGELAEILVGISALQQNIIERLQTEVLSEELLQQLLNLQNDLINRQALLVDKVTQAAKGKKAAEDGTLDRLRLLQAARERIIQQQQEQAARQLKIQTGVRVVSGLVQSLSSLLGGITTALDGSASASERLNGVWAAGTGTLAGVANILLPGSGILVQGIGSIIQSSLKLVGIWDAWEDSFKSALLKVQEFNEHIQKINLIDSLNNKKISSLESISEEYTILSQKAGLYGQNLSLMTQEEQDRYHTLTNEFSEYNSLVIAGYDEQGNAIVRGQLALDGTIQKLKLAAAAAKLAELGTKLDVIQSAKNAQAPNRLKIERRAEDLTDFTFFGYEKGMLVTNLQKWNILNQVDDTLAEFATELYDSGERGRVEITKAGELVKIDIRESIDEYRKLLNLAFDSTNFLIVDPLKYKLLLSLGEGIRLWIASHGEEDLSLLIAVFGDWTEDSIHKALLMLTNAEGLLVEIIDNFSLNVAKSYIDYLLVGSLYKERYQLVIKQAEKAGFDEQYVQSYLQKFLTSLQATDENLDQGMDMAIELAEKIGEIFETYGKLLYKAEIRGTSDLKEILENENLGSNEVQQAIIDSINTTFKDLLNDSDFVAENGLWLNEFIKRVYNLDGIKIEYDTQTGLPIVTAIKDYNEKLKLQILLAFTGEDDTLVVEYLSGLNLSTRQLEAVLKALEGKIFDSVGSMKRAIRLAKDSVLLELNIEPNLFVENFSKILSAINKVVDNKNLSYKDKLNLQLVLGLTSEDMASLTTNALWLKRIKELILSIPDNADNLPVKIQAVIDTYDNLADVRRDYGEDSEVYQYAAPEVFEKLAEAAKVDIETLKLYAETRHLAFTTTEDQENVLNLYKQSTSVTEAANTIKVGFDTINQSFKDLASGKKDANEVTILLDKLRDAWNLLTGQNASLESFISQLNLMAIAILTGITDLSRLRLLQAQGYQGGAVQQYNQAEAKVLSGEQAVKNFATGSVSEEDAARLSQMLAEWQALRDVVSLYGRDSQQYLDMINRISEAERTHLSTVRDEKLAIIESNKNIILQEIEQLRHEGETAGLLRRKEITEQIAQKTQLLHSLDDEQSQLLFQDSAPQLFKLDSDIKTEDFLNLKDYIRDNIKLLEDFDESLVDNDKALQEVTSDLLRYEAALKKVEKNYSKWSKALTDGSIQENALAMEELRDTYGDILGFPADALSDSFAGSTLNLQLMQLAMNGSEEAYDQLMQAAQQDIETQCNIDVNDEDFWAAKDEVLAAMDLMNFLDIEVGASLDNADFLQALTDMVNAAGMTADQATAYLASMGVDALVTTDTTSDQSQSEHANWIPTINPIPMQYTAYAVSGTGPNTQLLPLQQTGYVPLVTYTNSPQTGTEDVEQKSFALKVVSANKSSGGGIKHKQSSGGGGGGGGKGGGCFVAGTLVSLAAGFKNIEDILIGDIVLSYNEQFRINEYSTVLQTMIHDVEELIFTLYIKDEKLIVTGIHRFLIIRSGEEEWIPASELEVGDLVLFADGTLHTIFRIDVEVKSERVYNFLVSNNHNYYVGKNQILAHNKGGGGKDNTPKKTVKKAKRLKTAKDPYRKINLQLGKANREFDKLEKQKLKSGKKGITDILDKETAKIKLQIGLYKTKYSIQNKELDKLKKKLGKKGFIFDDLGDISNYDAKLDKLYKKYKQADNRAKNYLKRLQKENKLKYGTRKLTNDQAEKYNKLKLNAEKALKKQQDIQKLVEEYDELKHEEIEDLKETVYDLNASLLDLKIEDFTLKILLLLLTQQAQRDYNEFRRKVIKGIRDDDILGNTKASFDDLGSYYNPINNTGEIKTLSENLKKVTEAYNTLKAGGQDETFSVEYTNADGTKLVIRDVATAELKMKLLLNQLEDSMGSVEDLILQIKQSVFDIISSLGEALNYQQSQYDVITDQLTHHLNLIQMFYGDEAYAAMAGYYEVVELNNNNELLFLRSSRDYWYNLMLKQRQVMNSINKDASEDEAARWKEANDLFRTYELQYRSSVSQLNATTLAAAQNIIDKYTNAIKQIFAELNTKLTGYTKLDYINEEWLLINKQSLQYLDNINAAYEIEKLETAYKQAIDDNQDNLAAQKSLNEMMEEELKYLREKDKLTQYDVDRANALLNIEIKRLALKQARQSKTKLRLRRDSQGNFAYQYTSDQTEVDKARQELADALNELYNKTRQAYINNLNNYYSFISEWQEKVVAVMTDTTLTAEQQDAKIKEYALIYGDLINGTVENNELYRRHLMTDTLISAERLYGLDESNFNQLSYNKRVQALWLSAKEKEYAEATTEEKKAQYAEDLKNYGQYVGDVEEVLKGLEGKEGSKAKLSDETITELFGDYDSIHLNFNQMMNGGGKYENGGMTGIWKNGLTSMMLQMTGEGGFQKTALTVYTALCVAVGNYQASITKLQKSANVDFGKIKTGLLEVGSSTNKLKTAIEDLAKSGTTSFAAMQLAVKNLDTSTVHAKGSVEEYIKKLGNGNEGLQNTLNSAIKGITDSSKPLITAIQTQYTELTKSNGLLAALDSWKTKYDNIKTAAEEAAKAAAKAAGIDTDSFYLQWYNQFIKGNNGENGGGSSKPTTETKKDPQQQRKDEASNLLDKVFQLQDDISVNITTTNKRKKAREGMKKDSSLYDLATREIEGLRRDRDTLRASLNGMAQLLQSNYSDLVYIDVDNSPVGAPPIISYKKKFDTGGYTGSWGREGRLAMLHEKELVLNAKDTENFLSAINIVRSLSDELNQLGNVASLTATLATNGELKQHVSIEAHFPNVSNSNEIEEAFNNLINRASQYVLGGR